MADETQVTTPTTDVASASPATPASPSIEEILNFDPFGPEEGEVSVTVAEPTPAATTEVTGDGSQTAATPAAQPQDVAPVANPEMDLLKKQHKEAMEELEKLKAGTKAQDIAKDQPQTSPKANIPAYEFEFPEPLVAALASEDPKEVQAGLRNLAQGVAQGIHQTIMAEVMQKIVPQIIAASVQANQQHTQSTAEVSTMRKDFYGSFPELDKPEIHAVVGLVAGQLATEMGVQGYSPEFKLALRQRLTAMGIGSQAQAPTPAPKPPVMMQGNGGARPTPTLADEQQKQMMDLFD